MVVRVRKFLQMVGEEFLPYIEGSFDDLSDEQMMAAMQKIMNECKLSFTTFIVEQKKDGRR